MQSTGRVIVVGAGVAGLTCAAELAASGVEVLVLERAGAPGGKMRRVEVAGVSMDAGPTVFTMRWVFEELFEALGTRLDEHLGLRPVDVLARHAWSPTERLDLHVDLAQSADAIHHFAGARAAREYLGFCARAADIYRTLDAPFLRASRPTPFSLATRVGARGLPGLLRISPWTTLWSELCRQFEDVRLRQLFGRYATYCGSSPFLAPATLMLVAHVEQQGVWQVDGGMHCVAQALAALAERHGAAFRYDAQVDEIVVRDGRAQGVRLADGESLQADAVVFNGDVSALATGLLGGAARRAASPTDPRDRSLSALTWNMLAETTGFPLARHSVFFSSDTVREFRELRAGRLPSAPTVYVCAQDRGGPIAPRGAERLLLIVNAPARGDDASIGLQEIEECEARTFDRLAQCGLHVKKRPTHCLVTSPTSFAQMFPATGGALYGRASHGWTASFSRPGARSGLAGLYLAGGSVHPGPGVPMAALSGRQAAASLLVDLPKRIAARRSIATSNPVVTHGGTSTP